ncbi:MAG: plastocyanin/azurin family copper-binding protein [Acidimicrobiia bacterium]
MMRAGTIRRHTLLIPALALFTFVSLGAVVILASRSASDAAIARDRDGALGPGSVTVQLDVEHSQFSPTHVVVHPHTTVEFVVVNHDPIGHELIVGDATVHAIHAAGHEASHPPRSGEVSVAPHARAATTFTFHEPGTVLFACHLPGHFEYGMHGTITIVGESSSPRSSARSDR